MNAKAQGCAVEFNLSQSVITGVVHIDEIMIDRISAAVDAVISKQIVALKETIADFSASARKQEPRQVNPPGVELSDDELGRVAGLRTSLLNGKLPKDAGLLIDTKATAMLLNVSARTLYRLNELKAVPEPVRLGGNIVRWRLAEILQWIERGCPSRRNWTYPDDRRQRLGQSQPGRRRSEHQRP